MVSGMPMSTLPSKVACRTRTFFTEQIALGRHLVFFGGVELSVVDGRGEPCEACQPFGTKTYPDYPYRGVPG